jgi:DNA-binding Lrp family transcriptional regulator
LDAGRAFLTPGGGGQAGARNEAAQALPELAAVRGNVDLILDTTYCDPQYAFPPQPEVLECHMVAGGFDYLIKARVGDMDAYRAFLGDVLVRMPGVRETRTYAVLEEVKSTTVLPI